MFNKIAWVISFFILYNSGEVLGLKFNEAFNKSSDFLLKEINPNNIADNLRYLTKQQHIAGTQSEWDTAQWVHDTWIEQGLDSSQLVEYDVLLSYPDKKKPNYARIHDENGDVIWTSQGKTIPLHSPEESSDVYPDFNAFSPPGNITADIIYVNFGREKDFDRLKDLGINVTGNLVIARYGKVFRANIVKSAQIRGAVGVLLYADGQEYAQEGGKRVYPETVWMPNSAAPYGTVYINDGDPLTPFFPSIESAFRLPIEEAELPKIPVMPISFKDAHQLLSKMGGDDAPTDWQGALNTTYKLGPGLAHQGFTTSMEVNTSPKRTTIKNVVGVIRGSIEPDRYVILGNHRDAWIFGAVDPSSATAVMMELTRSLMALKKQTGWSPRRSLVFCSWGAEEYGLIGSQEWVEQFSTQLSDRGIAYLNLDMAIEGNYTLRTKAVPLLFEASREISKIVPNPDPKEVERGMKSVYDTWLDRAPDDENPEKPQMRLIGSGSDYKPFQHKFGIPCQEYRYTHSKDMHAQPLYHTLYETFYLVNELYDRGFHFHKAMGQLWGALAIYLADEQLLPFSLSEYALFIDDAQQKMISNYATVLVGREKSIGYFLDASIQFTNATAQFEEELPNIDKNNVLAVRRANDQMMQVERSFIDRRGLPGRPDYNHVIVAPSSSDSYAGAAFSGLTDALNEIEKLPVEEQKIRWRTFDQHLAACTHFLLVAVNTLRENLW